MSHYLIQRQVDGEIIPTIMYEIFDCESRFGEIRKLHYKGWQPKGLIELVDERGEVVVSGYGEDH